jgi:hypothetical protein
MIFLAALVAPSAHGGVLASPRYPAGRKTAEGIDGGSTRFHVATNGSVTGGRRFAAYQEIRIQSMRTVQAPRVHSEADHDLMVHGSAPQTEMLAGEVYGYLVGNLVFHAFEQRYLALEAG